MNEMESEREGEVGKKKQQHEEPNRRRNSSIDSKLSAIFARIVLVCAFGSCVCARASQRFFQSFMRIDLIYCLLLCSSFHASSNCRLLQNAYFVFFFRRLSSAIFFLFSISMLFFLDTVTSNQSRLPRRPKMNKSAYYGALLWRQNEFNPNINETRNNLVIKIDSIHWAIFFFLCCLDSFAG